MSKYKIWSATQYDVVLGNQNFKNKKKQIHVTASRGENEGSQLVISGDFKESLSSAIFKDDLYSDEGILFSHRNIEIYHAKFVDVGGLLYPDALLPSNTKRMYTDTLDEGVINKIFWLNIKIPENQAAGIYKGFIQVDVGGIKYEIVIEVEVLNFLVSESESIPTSVTIGSDGLLNGENNYFPEMYRLYVERLIKFRLAPAKLIQYLNIPYIEGKDFTDEMQYLFKNGKQLKMYNIPIHNTDTGFNEDSYTELIKEIIKISLEDNINYFEKAMYYYQFKNQDQEVEFKNIVLEIADNMRKEFSKNKLSPLLFDSLINIKNYAKQNFEGVDGIVLYPQYRFEPDIEKRKAYSNIKSYALKHRSGSSNTHVGYKCLEIAQNPYGVLAHLIQQSQHNIEGLFLWESVMNYKLVWDESIQYNHQYRIDNLYQNIFRNGYNPGDGFLFYPGSPVEIEGPIETVRLHRLRDAIEKYKYLEHLNHLYNQKGINKNAFELFGQQMTQAAKQEDGERMASLFRKILEEIEVLDK